MTDQNLPPVPGGIPAPPASQPAVPPLPAAAPYPAGAPSYPPASPSYPPAGPSYPAAPAPNQPPASAHPGAPAQTYPGAPVGYQPGQQPGAPRKSRKGLIIGLSIGLAVVLLGGGGLAAGAAAISSSAAPDKQVREFLQDLVDGKAEAALALMGEKPSGLLTDEAYRASSNHITDFSVGKAKTKGDASVVSAKITQGGTSYTQEFTLAKAGTTFLIFDTWQLDPLPLGLVDVQVQGPEGVAITVDGEEIDAKDITKLAAFPGDYEVALAGDGEMFEAEPVTASVVGLSEEAAGSIGAASLETKLTEAGNATALAAIDAFIDSCIAQKSLKPDGCGFEARPNDGVTYSNIVWTLPTRPTFSIGAWAGDGWTVTTESAGTLDVKADAVDASGRSGTSGVTIPNYRYTGTVSIVDGVATFTPLILPL
jgi:hypothetical protein